MFGKPLAKYYQSLVKTAQANDISYLALFGSYSRGEQKPDSDVDFLISFNKKKKKSLFDIIRIEQQISELLGKKADVVTKQGLSKYIKPYIQDDLQVIYAEKS